MSGTMKPYGDDIVNLRAQADGYWQAVRRLDAAVGGHDPVAAYVPLFDALNWAVALDERIKETWAPEGKPLRYEWRKRAPGAEALAGVRWARNSIHHDWANALRLDTRGRRYPKRYPTRYFEWVWHDASALPATSRTRGRETYEVLLAGQPADRTLHVLGEAFSFVIGLLEPPLPSMFETEAGGP